MATLTNRDLAALDPKRIIHPVCDIGALEESGPRIIAEGKGAWLTDADGHSAIDAVAGLWCSNVGRGRPEIAAAMAKAVETLDYSHTFGNFSHPSQILLADRLIGIAPEGLSHVFFGTSGSDCNDTIIKLLWAYNIIKGRPEKRKFISRMGAYHGTSITSASLTGLPAYHKQFGLPLDFVKHAAHPHFYSEGKPGETEAQFTARMLADLEALIAREGAETIAAFIGEPIMGAGGVVTPPEGYWAGVQEICRRNDIKLVVDEVICGYGRLGQWFGSQHYDIKPDVMASAKGLTSGIFPMSAAYFSEEIHAVLREGSAKSGAMMHGYTYTGHPVGAATALAVLDILERENVLENVRTVGAHFQRRLRETFADHPNVGEVRGVALIGALQIVEDKATKKSFDASRKAMAVIGEACWKAGVVVRPLGALQSLAFSPPLTITREEADIIVDRTAEGLAAGLKGVGA